MKTIEKISTLAIGLALITGLLSCKPEVEYIEKPVEKEYAKAVTFDSTASEEKVTVTMKTETEDAVIYYTIDGKTIPSAESTKYTEALTCTEDTVIMAIAVKEGIKNSPLSYAKVSITEKKIVEEKVVEKEVEKKADEVAPAKVTNLSATAKDCRVLLTWTDAADTDVYGYEVSYSGTNAINRVALPALDSKSMMVPQGAGGCYVSGLTNGTEYTFTVKTVDTSGNKSAGVTATATPVAPAAGETLQIALSASVPNTNKLGEAYNGTKSNTKVTVTANITSASSIKKVVWKKNGSLIAKTLLADNSATEASVTSDNSVWKFDITAEDETANGTYTVAVIDNAGREEAEQITIDQFDFTPPSKVTDISDNYQNSQITLSWTEPADADYDHVAITYTYNDGSTDSQPSQAVSVAKGTLTKTFEDILGTAKYYTFSLVSVDSLGNTSTVKSWKVGVADTVSNCPEGFVAVEGSTVTGGTKFALPEQWVDYYKGVFREGRTVKISDFYMCDHEVTQAEFQSVMGRNPSSFSDSPASGEIQENRPVENVNWYMAIAYCNKKSAVEGLTPCYTISGITDWANLSFYSIPTDDNTTWNEVTCDFTVNGYRLPTEAEWEYAALGGKNGAQAENPTDYAGTDSSSELGKYAWYSSNSNGMTHEVKLNGTDSTNALGLYDMSGNVWEWCWDWYDDNNTPSITSETPATGVLSGSIRVIRGGSCDNEADICSVAFRGYGDPSDCYRCYGFRVVRSAQ